MAVDTFAGSHLESLLKHQRALAGALVAASELLRGACPELGGVAAKCSSRAEELFRSTAEVVQGYATSAEQVLCLMRPGGLAEDGPADGDVGGLAAIGQKTQAAYEELEKDIDSLVMRLSFTETGVRTPLLEAVRAPSEGYLARGRSSCGGLHGNNRTTSSSVASTVAPDEEAAGLAIAAVTPTYESEGRHEGSNTESEYADGAKENDEVESGQRVKHSPSRLGVERPSASESQDCTGDSERLLRALESSQEAGLAVRGCCAALVSMCSLLRKQLLMKENIQCLLESCARSPALHRRCQQRLDEHAALWQALAASSRQYCDGHEALAPACH